MNLNLKFEIVTYVDEHIVIIHKFLFSLGLLPFFLYDLPFQRKMDVNELVLDYNSKKRSVKRYKTGGKSPLKMRILGYA